MSTLEVCLYLCELYQQEFCYSVVRFVFEEFCIIKVCHLCTLFFHEKMEPMYSVRQIKGK